jgi:phenylalanyl-tRNA synthetase beta chain
MPTITLSKKELVKALGKKLSEKDLKDRISMLGTDLEKIEGDDIHVEIFPNRPDLLSQQGFARALSSFIGAKTGLKKYDVKKSGEKCIVDKSVAKCRPYTACAIVKGLKLDDQKIKDIIQVQEKLHVTFCRNRKKAAIGIYPMEKIQFPIHFKGLKPSEIKFHPLEARGEMTGEDMIEHHPTCKAYAHLMDGLDTWACFIDDAGKYLSLTPLINSHLTGKVTEKTKDVFIECSGFDQRVLDECLNMVVTTLADMGGQIYSMDLVYPTKKLTSPNLTPSKMKVDRAYINKLLGLELKETEIKKYLERMGFGYEKGSALIPAYRTDILHQADLAEDVAIAYGYENFTATIPNIATVGGADRFETFCEKIRNLLVGHGLLETKNYHLINHDAQTTYMRVTMDNVKVQHPVSLDYDSLRAWIIPSLVETLQRNKSHEYPQAFFEIGRVFAKDRNNETDTGVKEQVRVAVALCGEKADYTSIRQILDDVFAKLDLQPTYKNGEHPSFIPGRVARVFSGKDGVAFIGELHPETLTNFELTMPVATFELNLSVLHKQLQE